MHRGNLSRRGFLERALATLIGTAGLPLWYAREMLAAEASAAAPRWGPNDHFLVGVIGCGGRCRQLLPVLARFPEVHIRAVCDVDPRHREEVANLVGGSPAKYHDFRELCARKDLDAVVIATPDHWHALIALTAMKAGKDVYCEKPLTLTIAEGQALVKVARAGDRVFQTGTQQRSDPRFRLACELVRNGRLGK